MSAVIARHHGKPAALPGDSRRRSDRTPYVAEAWIWSPTITSEDEKIEVISLNLSRHGVGFTLRQPLAVGTFMNIELDVGQQQIISEIRIIHCHPTEDGRHEVGAEFC